MLRADRDAARHNHQPHNQRREASAPSKEPRMNHVNHNNNNTLPNSAGLKDRKHSGGSNQSTGGDGGADSFVSTVLYGSGSGSSGGGHHPSAAAASGGQSHHVPHGRPTRTARPHQFKDYMQPAAPSRSPNWSGATPATTTTTAAVQWPVLNGLKYRGMLFWTALSSSSSTHSIHTTPNLMTNTRTQHTHSVASFGRRSWVKCTEFVCAMHPLCRKSVPLTQQKSRFLSRKEYAKWTKTNTNTLTPITLFLALPRRM